MAARRTAAAGPVLVVGASLAGATAATALREAGYTGPLTLLGEEDTLPYERPALSKTYLTGATSAEALLVHPAQFYAEQGIALRLGAAAVALDVERRRIRLASGEQVEYGTLVIATGAGNVRPRIPGIDLHGVHQLRRLADADALRAALSGARTAVVVGMGFIGCEVTATLRGLDVAVTVVDAMPGPLWGPLGPDLSAVARRWHEQHGVRVLPHQSVTAFLPDATGTVVAAAAELASGERLTADLVVVSVGVRPNTDWLPDTGLRLVAGAVGVDVEGRTSLPDVYAAGDVTATWDQAAGTHRRHEHWSSAIAQARRAARHIAGAAPDPCAPPYFWSDQYDKTLQYSGEHDPDSQLVLRGDPTQPERPLSGFFLSGERLTAVLAVNDGRQFRRAQRLLGDTPDPADLADPTVDLRHLAQPAPTPASCRDPATSKRQDSAVKPFDQIDALERARFLDPFARRLDGLTRAVSKPRRLRSILAGEPFGHSAHPMFVQLPIGAWVSAGWLDCLPRTEHSAAVLTGVGIVGALPAVAAGLVDYASLNQRQRRVAVVHATANALALACQVASLRERRFGRLRRGQWIGLAGTATLTVGGLLGGHLAHRLSAPRLPAHRPTPTG